MKDWQKQILTMTENEPVPSLFKVKNTNKMNIKVNGEKFRVEFEGGTYDPGDRWTPPDHEPINIVSIEWKQNDRYIDVTDLLENELFDLDLFIDVLSEEINSMNEPDY